MVLSYGVCAGQDCFIIAAGLWVVLLRMWAAHMPTRNHTEQQLQHEKSQLLSVVKLCYY